MHVRSIPMESEDESVRAPAFASGPRLSSGSLLPSLGFGIPHVRSRDEALGAVKVALEMGYRRIDVGCVRLPTDDVISRAISSSHVQRSEVVVSGELSLTHCGYEETITAVQQYIEQSGILHLDLLLLSDVGNTSQVEQAWRALIDCQARGLVRDIGVSGFGCVQLEALMRASDIIPAVNRLQVRPWRPCREVVAYCHAHDIVVETYLHPETSDDLNQSVLMEIAVHMGVSEEQALAAWCLAKGLVIMIASQNPIDQRHALESSKIWLEENDLRALDALG